MSTPQPPTNTPTTLTDALNIRWQAYINLHLGEAEKPPTFEELARTLETKLAELQAAKDKQWSEYCSASEESAGIFNGIIAEKERELEAAMDMFRSAQLAHAKTKMESESKPNKTLIKQHLDLHASHNQLKVQAKELVEHIKLCYPDHEIYPPRLQIQNWPKDF